ncbi:DUF342 domain-containing protein [[Mycoplasma] falconis]|uniref:DUF342 domain-containing protein n=1 Tax=[Mycoplasma] falconis TaxID=92403 RepID=A0A501XAF7_9BACT|nr:DUF342 domain-containing protein [[Mycoplasma] falconis]TPE57343.1 DUF342 domain-containing protein [[Mycoplasma] falconis]
MLSFLEETNSATTSSEKPAASTPSHNWIVFILISLALLAFALYMSIKFIVYFKQSAKKTKDVLGNDLVIKYVQGFKLKSSSALNWIMINILYLFSLIVVIIGVIKARGIKSNNINIYYVLIALSIIGLIATNTAILLIWHLSFNYPQYKHGKKDIDLELKSLHENIHDELSLEYPAEIKIDVKKMEANNPLLPRVLANFISFYNKMETKNNWQQYLEFLNQQFKIKFFNESLAFIENEQRKEQEILGSDESTYKVNKNSSQIEKEVAWMEHMDKKVSIIKETQNFEKMNKKEFDKKYEEYLYTVRSQDPMYQQIQKNSWLTYRDNDIEDLFYNPNSVVVYSLNNGQDVKEKSLNEFLNEYKHYLKAKFLSDK